MGDPIPAFPSQTLSVCATFVRPCTWPLPVVAGGVSCDDSMRIVKSPEEFAAGAVCDAAYPVIAFCEGAGLSNRELPALYAPRRPDQWHLRNHKAACQRGSNQRAPSAMAEPARPVARLVRIDSKRLASRSAYNSQTARAPRTQPSSPLSPVSLPRASTQNASGLMWHHPDQQFLTACGPIPPER